MVEQQVIKSHEAMYSYFYHNPNDVEWSNQWSLVSHNKLLHCRDNHQCIIIVLRRKTQARRQVPLGWTSMWNQRGYRE